MLLSLLIYRELKLFCVSSRYFSMFNLFVTVPFAPLKSKELCFGCVKSYYFIKSCQIFAMELNVSKEITSMDLNDKIIA